MVHFIEMTGGNAEGILRRLAERCRTQGDRAELLVNVAEPDRYLLMCWGDGPDEAPTAEHRHWTFRQLAEDHGS